MTATTITSQSSLASTSGDTSRRQLMAGRVVTGLVVAFLTFDAISHILRPQVVRDSFKEMGWPAESAVWVGVAMAVSLVLYLIPRTNMLGALLITAYLGGAVAANVSIEASFFGSVLFPVYTAVFVWGGLWLRDAEVRKVLPFRR